MENSKEVLYKNIFNFPATFPIKMWRPLIGNLSSKPNSTHQSFTYITIPTDITLPVQFDYYCINGDKLNLKQKKTGYPNTGCDFKNLDQC